MPQLNYPHLASMVFNTPLFATRTAVDAVKSVLVPKMQGINVLVNNRDIQPLHEKAESLTMSATNVAETINGDGMYTVANDQIAIVKVHGLLMARRGHITAECTELNSYERIRNNIQRALDHDAVAEIVLDLNSGGGMAVGCKELADFINQAKNTKPITAIVNYAAYSACYFIAAACSQIIVSPTSGVGSIGVIIEHMEMSKMEDAMGLTFTTLYRGDHKNDGSPHEPITEQTLAALNKRLDEAYAMFVESVARYRGLEQQTVIDTQAGLMSASEAIELGFADELMDPITAITAIAEPYQQTTEPPAATPVTARLTHRAKAMAMANQL